MFKFIDLFSGIGGIRLGFENAGGECVLSSEKDKFARQTYAANFKTDIMNTDIKTLKSSEIPSFDVLVAGFPCQPFSISGVTSGNYYGNGTGFLHKTSGTMFFEVARILNDCKPKTFFLENVPNLIHHDKGRTFKVIMDTLQGLGYHVSYKVISSEPFVPQRRNRIYIVGNLEKEFVFPEMPTGTHTLKEVLHHVGDKFEEGYTNEDGTALDKFYVTDRMMGYFNNHSQRHHNMGNGFGHTICTEDDIARTICAHYYKDGGCCLIHDREGNPRNLTPREIFRLMGFSDDYVIPVSKTQAYKQGGNSVVVPVIKFIANEMKNQGLL